MHGVRSCQLLIVAGLALGSSSVFAGEPSAGLDESPAPALHVPALTTPAAESSAASPSSADAALDKTITLTPLALARQPEAGKVTIAPDESFWIGWKHKVEAGLSGTSGNSEGFSVRALLGAKRLSENMETTADVGYIFVNNEGKKTKSRGEGNLRNDWLFKDSPWGFFAVGKLEYDEFQRWQWRASGYAGPSYTFIKNDRTVLRGRVGIGGNYEFGKDAKEKIVPELDLGIDLSHKLTERQSVFLTLDYYPSLDHFPAYRAVGKAGWELLVDPEVNMYLKAGVTDRYISSPGEGFKRNDLEYFLTLGWEF